MFRKNVDKMKVTSGLSSWEEAHSKLISLDEEQQCPIDSLEGEQLEEIVATRPLDLSVFNNVPLKTTRNSESPLDLSLKTRKRIADSTEEENEQLWLAARMHALKRACPGVSSMPSGDYVSDRHMTMALTGKQTSPGVSSASVRENLHNHHAKRELKAVNNLNSSSVIKHGFHPSTNQGLQHGIPHIGDNINNTNMPMHSGYIHNERKGMFSQNNGNCEPVKSGRNNDRKYYSKQNIPVQQHHSQVLPAQDQTPDVQRQRFYKHPVSNQQIARQIPGLSFQTPKRRNPSIVVGTVCSSPSTILQYHPFHIGSPLSPSLNRHSPFVETVQRCSPDSTIPVKSPQRMSPNEIECYGERMRHMFKSDNSTSRLNHTKHIPQQILHPLNQSQKYGYMHYSEPMSPVNPGSSSSSSSSSPCISSHGEKSPMMMSSHGSPQSFLAISPSPMSARSQIYMNHPQPRSREDSPLGVRTFPHSLSPLVQSSYGSSHSFSPQTTMLNKGRERSPTMRPCKVQERSILKGTSGLYRGPSTQVSHSVNDSQSIPNICDKKPVISENPSQHYTQKTKGHIPASTGHSMTQSPQQFVGDKMINQVQSIITRVKVESCDNSDRIAHKTSERRYMLKNEATAPSPTSNIPHLMKIEKIESSSYQQTECSTNKVSKPCQMIPDNRPNTSTSDQNDDTELDRYSHPLTIAIPTSVGANTSDRQQTLKSPGPPATSVRAPRPFSKKQIIMNAFNNDEGLKKMVNSPVTPRPSKYDLASISAELGNTNRLQNHSPSFPESPKMPTLSPQQKMSPAMVTPMTVEPPTLAPAATLSAQRFRQDSNMKMSMKKLVPFGATDIKSDRLIESEFKQNEDTSVKGDSRHCRQDHTILGGNTFGKRQGLKNIPIANVSPMVHGHSAKPASVSNVNNTSSVIMKAECQRKDPNTDSKLATNQQQNICVREKTCLQDHKDTEQQCRNSCEKVGYKDDRVITHSNANCVLQNGPPRVGRFDKGDERKSVRKVLNFDQMMSLEYMDDDILCKDIENEEQYNTDDEEDETKRQMRLKQRHRSLLHEIANSDGYVAENKTAAKTDDLLVDPALLGREERALRVSILFYVFFNPSFGFYWK